MLDKLKSFTELQDSITTDLLENGVGVIIDSSVSETQYIALNVDYFYHHAGLSRIPAIVDLVIVGKDKEQDNFHIFVVEMKNINGPDKFNRQNIYDKFATAIEDFMKNRYKDPFLNKAYNVIECKLYFIADAYHFKEKGYSVDDYNSFLKGTKNELLQAMNPFEFRGSYLIIDYRIPNPLLKW